MAPKAKKERSGANEKSSRFGIGQKMRIRTFLSETLPNMSCAQTVFTFLIILGAQMPIAFATLAARTTKTVSFQLDARAKLKARIEFGEVKQCAQRSQFGRHIFNELEENCNFLLGFQYRRSNCSMRRRQRNDMMGVAPNFEHSCEKKLKSLMPQT